MSGNLTTPVVVLVGPPASGCTSVAAAWAAAHGGPDRVSHADLAERVAASLGVKPELALVAVGEERYRQAELAEALALLRAVQGKGADGGEPTAPLTSDTDEPGSGENADRGEATASAILPGMGEATDQGEPAASIISLGSGCLGSSEVRAELARLREAGALVVALTASTRRLAHRNGLDAPRSVALGNVNHAFTLMLHAREQMCRDVAQILIDTTDTTPEQAAAQIETSAPSGKLPRV